jgi:aspartate dehydrogenase
MKIGIAGLGAIGLHVAQELDRGGIPGCELAGISARNADRAADANATLSKPYRRSSSWNWRSRR